MYLIVIGWMYVVLMMSVAEATNTTGTVLGAIVTFLLYGVLPVVIVVYLLRAPQRRKAIRAREAQEDAARNLAQRGSSDDPPPGRPKADQPPRGAATRAAAERGGSISPDAGREAPGAAEPGSIPAVGKEP